jgi:hypothetical protein
MNTAATFIHFRSGGAQSTFASGLDEPQELAFQPIAEPSARGLPAFGATALLVCLHNKLAASFGAFQRSSETFAGISDFFSCHNRQSRPSTRARPRRACAFHYWWFDLVCSYFCFGWFAFFSGKCSASVRWAASSELATFKIEFLPPNGLGTDSRASGSGIHWPSTIRQYS